MKITKIVLSVAFAVFSISFSQAQSPFDQSEVKAKQITFRMTGHNQPDSKSVAVENKANGLVKNSKGVNRSHLTDIKMNGNTALADIFLSVFGESRMHKLLPEKRIILLFHVNKAGKVLETGYLLDKNTKITPQELEELERELKKQASFSFKVVESEPAPFYTITKAVNFDKVLDGTLK